MTDLKTEFIIQNVRLSFPDLFQVATYEGKSTGKFGATFILGNETHAADIAALKATTSVMIKGELKGKRPEKNYLCLKTNASYTTEREEYADALMVKAMNTRRPTLIDRSRQPIVEEDNILYSGCYVNVKFKMWAKKTKGGPTVGADLITVQFAADGEAFDGSYISEEDAIADFAEMDPGDGFAETQGAGDDDMFETAGADVGDGDDLGLGL